MKKQKIINFQTTNSLKKVYLFSKVVLIIEGLTLLIPIDHFACGRCNGDAVNLKLPRPLPRLLLQVHLLDILLRHRPLPLNGGADLNLFLLLLN